MASKVRTESSDGIDGIGGGINATHTSDTYRDVCVCTVAVTCGWDTVYLSQCHIPAVVRTYVHTLLACGAETHRLFLFSTLDRRETKTLVWDGNGRLDYRAHFNDNDPV